MRLHQYANIIIQLLTFVVPQNVHAFSQLSSRKARSSNFNHIVKDATLARRILQIPLRSASKDETSDDYNTSTQYRPGSLMAATAEQGRVPYGEESRKYRRTEFSHDDWVDHRTTEKRIISNLSGLFFSGIVRQLKEEIILVTLAATVTVLWNDFLIPLETSSESFMSVLPQLSLPALPFTLCSPALGLLLVFKTNASYARWSEARNTWAKIVSQARNVVRMAATFVPQTENGFSSIHDLSNAVWLLCRSLMNDLTGPGDEENFRSEVMEVFSIGKEGGEEDIVIKMFESKDRSMAALTHASRALDNVPIDEKRRVEIDKSLVIIGDCIGTCEKIYSSPVPLVCKWI